MKVAIVGSRDGNVPLHVLNDYLECSLFGHIIYNSHGEKSWQTLYDYGNHRAMTREELLRLRELYEKFYLMKRDDQSCRAMFAIQTVRNVLDIEIEDDEIKELFQIRTPP